MLHRTKKERILIIGGSGFIGHSLFRELQSFFDVYGTYCKNKKQFANNAVFHHYNVEKDDINPILNFLKPTVVICAFRAEKNTQIHVYKTLAAYAEPRENVRVCFLSPASVFDAKFSLPAYENTTTLSESLEGKTAIAIEKLLLKKIPKQTIIARLPLILGLNSPTIFHLKQCVLHQVPFDVYPNRVISANTIDKICLQIHYIINQSLSGIFHLATNDLIHHDELFFEISKNFRNNTPIFKNVYASNSDRYYALLPKYNRLPTPFQITIEDVIRATTLHKELFLSL